MKGHLGSADNAAVWGKLQKAATRGGGGGNLAPSNLVAANGDEPVGKKN